MDLGLILPNTGELMAFWVWIPSGTFPQPGASFLASGGQESWIESVPADKTLKHFFLMVQLLEKAASSW